MRAAPASRGTTEQVSLVIPIRARAPRAVGMTEVVTGGSSYEPGPPAAGTNDRLERGRAAGGAALPGRRWRQPRRAGPSGGAWREPGRPRRAAPEPDQKSAVGRRFQSGMMPSMVATCEPACVNR